MSTQSIAFLFALLLYIHAARHLPAEDSSYTFRGEGWMYVNLLKLTYTGPDGKMQGETCSVTPA